ncbi:PepSY-associated TM helix domain-containing protein [Echinicola vietnamensis]|uniref:Putative iron-regulated membrane protein n=1 Tax=Echinicola vietnamensis (strain DSM 17526 / LMG 23754 / KMM 6221) TaxID=926556 RepID=L0G2U5_ECHVK|nr:PepSY-associated TM helix domain-containing protein [Echinicola vietnamensis]AGA80519.1 putative iron-regulated membrane protein [Echinicola vietnamensis DSM 17526]
MNIKKTIGKIHLWLGLTSGLVVFMVSITGCLWVFQDEIRPLVYQDRMYIDPPPGGNDRMPLTALVNAAEEALGNGYSVERAYYPTAENETVYIQFRKFNEGTDQTVRWYGDYIVYFYKVFLNPYTGEVVHIENTKWEFFNVVLWAHFTLLLPYSIGHEVVGYGILVFVVMLITGLVLWWPKNRSAARQRFWFRWKRTTRWKRRNYDLHNILGFYALVFALVMAVTGLVWSFDWVGEGIQWVANGGKSIKAGHKHPKITFSEPDQAQVLDAIMAKMVGRHPDARYFYIRFPRKEDSPMSINATMGNHGYGNYIRYLIHPYTAEIIEESRFENLTNGEKAAELNYPIHVGSILGIPGKVLAFLTSLVAASLPVSGCLIWLGKRRKGKRRPSGSRHPAQRPATTAATPRP